MRITGFATIAFVALWASVESITLEAEPHAHLPFAMKNAMGILHNAAPAIARHEASGNYEVRGYDRLNPQNKGTRNTAPGSAYENHKLSAAFERKLADEDIVSDSDDEDYDRDGDRGIAAEADEKPTLGTADYKHRGSHERHVSSADAGTMTEAEKAEAAEAREAHQHRHRRHRHTHSTSHQSGTPDRAHKHHHHHAHGEHH